jgi:hypothetical protein
MRKTGITFIPYALQGEQNGVVGSACFQPALE